ncbi:MAG: hypothetical protein U5K84_10670 [Alkalibacterium sp.]|nr:hypothetical protein [Alkalibacterium sp.]
MEEVIGEIDGLRSKVELSLTGKGQELKATVEDLDSSSVSVVAEAIDTILPEYRSRRRFRRLHDGPLRHFGN